MLQAFKKVLPDSLKTYLSKIVYKVFTPPYTPEPYPHTFSQTGEDVIANFLFEGLGITHPTYLDIGANDPVWGNNTFLFYRKGGKGVCIEPDITLFENLKNVRERDVCLNVAVDLFDKKEADFYIFSEPSLNTLSKEEAEFREKNGSFKIVKVIKIPTITVNQTMENYFDGAPDFLSIDVEGLDLEILKSINYEKFRPIVICTETIEYSETIQKKKITPIIDFLLQKDYIIFADTHINTIFVDKGVFEAKNQSKK